ncbi:hypothetical protein [Amnibacterium kyonggiense]|uniref:Uncharacterized protein n=1 Tax=Amnibacterium kyonggiense TaxID=595671 RepID=A0A4R7FJC9_9MICO|nr:hypothetical protein [Amnibacterium kyonggiense]TDS76185.1 hypothetical protein CLV52_3305 [Amnibacterium kyonggiense]
MNTTTQEQKPAAAERRTSKPADRSTPILPSAIGLVRATAAITRFVVAVGVDLDRRDPIDLEPRILRAA